MNRTSSLIAAVAAGCAAASVSAQNATTVAWDSYVTGTDPAAGEYNTGLVLKSQPANLQNLGFVDGPYSQGTGTSQFAPTTGGLEFAPLGALNATSGKVNYNAAAADGIYRANARNLDPVPASGTYWISHLVNRGSITDNTVAGFALTGFGNFVQPLLGSNEDLAGLFVGFAQSEAEDGNFGDLVIRYRSTGDTITDATLIDGSSSSTFGTTYAVIMKVDVNVGGGSTDTVSWWVDPTDVSSEAALTTSAASSGSFDSFAIANAGSFARLNYGARNWNGNVFFDEARLATDLTGIVPEPTSLALLGLGGLALLRRRSHA